MTISHICACLIIFGGLFISCVQNGHKAKVPIIGQPIELVSDISEHLDSFMECNSIDAILVFRLKDYDCSECKAYFINLYKETREMTGQAVLLSQFSGYRSVSVFKKMSGISDSVINYSNPIAEIDRSAYPYIFLYKGDGKINNLLIPINNSPQHNKQVIEDIIQSGFNESKSHSF